MVGNLHGADVALHEFTIQIGVWATSLRVELKGDVDVVHATAQTSFVDAAISSKQPVAQGKKGDTAIHGTCIYINIAYLAGQIFGHRALSTRRVTINSDCYLFHNVYVALINKDDALT